MFKSIDETWNVFVGCKFDCTYCNARKAALTRLKHCPRYKDGFKPHLVESELKRTFKPGQFIFIAYMGDIAFCKVTDFALIIERVRAFPLTNFLLQTKDPSCWARWGFSIPPNVNLGTTIETNRDYCLSQAPPPIERWCDLLRVKHPHKFISIEPIMDFDLEALLLWMRSIEPEIIEVGADNYHNHLPEPSGEKLCALLDNLRDICPNVIEKDGLDRLKREGELMSSIIRDKRNDRPPLY